MSAEEVLEQGRAFRQKFPGCIPVLIVPDKKSRIELKKKVYICRPEHYFLWLLMQIRKQIKVNANESLFYFIKNSIVMVSHEMGYLDKKYCDDGGFLVITIARENAFG